MVTYLKVTTSGYLSSWDASGGWIRQPAVTLLIHQSPRWPPKQPWRRANDEPARHSGARTTSNIYASPTWLASLRRLLWSPPSICAAATTVTDGPAARSSGVRALSLRRNEFRIRLFTYCSTTHNELLHYSLTTVLASFSWADTESKVRYYTHIILRLQATSSVQSFRNRNSKIAAALR